MEERGFTPETECERSAAEFWQESIGFLLRRKPARGGTMTMANALGLVKKLCYCLYHETGRAATICDFLEPDKYSNQSRSHIPSIALGACDLSLFEMLWGYTIFAGRGFSTKPYFISRIEDRNGNVIKRFDYSVNRKEAISEVTAYKMARMMQGTVDKGTASGLTYKIRCCRNGWQNRNNQ